MTIPLTNSLHLNFLTHWYLEENSIIPQGEPLAYEYETLSRQELKSRLTILIEGLLRTNFEKLCNMIYRHDVDETKFNAALQEGSIFDQASSIADLVIDRELQKVETRKAYRKEKQQKQSKELNRGTDDS
jgi:hypothetical protein